VKKLNDFWLHVEEIQSILKNYQEKEPEYGTPMKTATMKELQRFTKKELIFAILV